MTRTNKLYFLTVIMFFGVVAATVVAYCQGLLLHWKFPHNTFLFDPAVSFTDFFEVITIASDGNPYLNGANKSMYLPFANVAIYVLQLIKVRTLLYVYLGGLGVFSLAAGYVLCRRIVQMPLLFAGILTCCNYPLLFVMDRGNIEGVLFAMTVLFFVFLHKDRQVLAGLCLAVPVACKAFCVIYLLYAVSRRQYRAVVSTIVFSALLTVGALFFLKGGFMDNLVTVLFYNAVSQSPMMLQNNFTYQSYSLFSLIKVTLIKLDLVNLVNFSMLNRYYTLFSLGLILINAAYVVFSRAQEWKKLFVLTATIILLPPVSAVYRLLYFFIPIFSFINSRERGRFDIAVMAFFCLIITPWQYAFFSDFDIRVDAGKLPVIVPIEVLVIFAFNLYELFVFAHKAYVLRGRPRFFALKQRLVAAAVPAHREEG